MPYRSRILRLSEIDRVHIESQRIECPWQILMNLFYELVSDRLQVDLDWSHRQQKKFMQIKNAYF